MKPPKPKGREYLEELQKAANKAGRWKSSRIEETEHGLALVSDEKLGGTKVKVIHPADEGHKHTLLVEIGSATAKFVVKKVGGGRTIKAKPKLHVGMLQNGRVETLSATLPQIKNFVSLFPAPARLPKEIMPDESPAKPKAETPETRGRKKNSDVREAETFFRDNSFVVQKPISGGNWEEITKGPKQAHMVEILDSNMRSIKEPRPATGTQATYYRTQNAKRAEEVRHKYRRKT